MSKSATLNVRLDPLVKVRVQAVLDKLGLSTSEAINLFFKRVIAERGIPFKVKIPNKITKKTLRESEQGIGITAYESVDDIVEKLDI